VNFDRNRYKNQRPSHTLIVTLVQCIFAELMQRIIKCAEIQNTTVTPDKNDIYGRVLIYGKPLQLTCPNDQTFKNF